MSYFDRSGPVSLYLHFPFCERKCRYCDFLSGPADAEAREEYIELLCREIRLRACEAAEAADPAADQPALEASVGDFPDPLLADLRAGKLAPVDTVFIGGGTPSLMTPSQAARVMEAVYDSYCVAGDAEISMEVNPGTADFEKLRGFKAAGINRLSIGVQSFDDAELRMLGRIHTASEAREIFRAARKAGFDNINLDLMSALPGQKIETWTRNLREAVSLGPEHLSAYSLIIEDGTPFASMLDSKLLPELPSEEEDREMYHFTKEFLASNGYRRYEISNYARNGFECRHNCGYWTGHQYLGLGLGASSDLGIERFRNPDRMEEYREAVNSLARDPSSSLNPIYIRNERQLLTPEERMEEFMFLGLRMTDGVSANEFKRRFGITLEDRFGEVLRRHLEQNVICRIPAEGKDRFGQSGVLRQGQPETDTRIALTEYGMDVANFVMADYIL